MKGKYKGYWVGKKRSDTTKKKISVTNKKINKKPDAKYWFEEGHIPWNKGKKGDQVSARKGKKMPHLTGSKNPNWKGGITAAYRKNYNLANLRVLRKTILKRDGFRCQICGIFNDKLEIHHIIPWRISHDDSVENLITVCHMCHAKIEKTWNNK